MFSWYPKDDPKLMIKCTKFDLVCSKIPDFKWMTAKLYSGLKKVLWQDYEIIRNIYKYYSTLDT